MNFKISPRGRKTTQTPPSTLIGDEILKRGMSVLEIKSQRSGEWLSYCTLWNMSDLLHAQHIMGHGDKDGIFRIRFEYQLPDKEYLETFFYVLEHHEHLIA